ATPAPADVSLTGAGGPGTGRAGADPARRAGAAGTGRPPFPLRDRIPAVAAGRAGTDWAAEEIAGVRKARHRTGTAGEVPAQPADCRRPIPVRCLTCTRPRQAIPPNRVGVSLKVHSDPGCERGGLERILACPPVRKTPGKPAENRLAARKAPTKCKTTV